MSTKREKLVRLVVCLLLAGATFALYSEVGRHEFTTLDDPDYVTDNPEVMAGLTWSGARSAFTTTVSNNWHPLTCLSHMLDCQLFGLNAGAHHLESVVIHILNALLLLGFLSRVTKAFWKSAFVAALFALHPAHVESVAWISERKDLLSTLFFLLTLLAYAKYVKSKVQSPKPKAGEGDPNNERRGIAALYAPHSYALTLIFFTLGLMSKPMLVTLPFVLLLLDFWPFQRIKLTAENRGAKSWLPLLREKLPFFAVSAVSCAVTVWAQSKSIVTSEMIPMSHRALHSLASYSSYLGKIFWPAKLAVCYAFPKEPEYGLAAVSALLLLGISALALAWRSSRPYFLMGWLWYLGTLVPVIGIMQAGIQGLADRYTYIPSIGLFLALTWLLADLAASLKARARRTTKDEARTPGVEIALAGSGIAVLAAFAVLTLLQVKTWRNTRTLFEHALKVTDRNFMAHTSLGLLLAQEGKPQEAIEHFRASIEVMPTYPVSWLGMGNALYSIGKQSEGVECLKKMLALAPTDPEAIDGYALLLIKEKNLAEAERLFRRALELKGNFPEVHLHLAVLLQEQGRWDEAVTHYQAAIQFKPDGANVHAGYADGLFRRKQFEQAMLHYNLALRTDPSLMQAQLGLAYTLLEMRQVEQAAARFSAILTSSPNNAAALDGLGYVLAMQNRLEEAYSYFLRAVELAPTNSNAQLHLAMELARRGESAEAAAHYRLAVKYGHDLVMGMNNLAWLLATDPSAEVRNGAEAIDMAERACKISGDREPFFIGTLAAAYAEAGRFDEAARTAGKARDLARSLGMAEVAERNERLAELYRSGKPYRETPLKP